MKIVVRVVFLCGLAGFGCLSVLAQEWPISPDPYPTGSKVDKPIYATIDIADDMWRSQSRFSRDNMVGLMQYLAKIGVTRVYWLREPEYVLSDWLIPSQGNPEDAERIVVQAAHEAGLECYAIFKPFETGVLTSILPQSYPVPDRVRTIEMQTGRLPYVAPFIVDHPEFRIRRRPLQVDPNQAVSMIKLVKSDDASTGLTADNLEIWTSHDNGNFTRWSGTFSFNDGIERREGKSVRVLTLSKLDIPAEQRYIMVRTVGVTGDGPTPFANVPSRLMEVYGHDDVLIPSNGDDGVVPRSALTQTITLLCIQLNGNNAIPPEMVLPESYGKALETSSFNFGHSPTIYYGASPPPERRLESADGYIVVAKGKDMTMPSLHPIYPEVRAYWMSEIQTLIDHGFDGIDLRIDNHSTWLVDADEYGFNGPVVAAYKQMYGIDTVKEQFDPDHWREIQGDSYTQFLKEARELTRRKNRPLHLHVSGVLANITPGFDLNNLPRNFAWQWERWIAEDLCDGIHLKLLPWPWGSYRGRGQDFAVKAIQIAHRYGKSVSADTRIQTSNLISTEKGAVPLTVAQVDEVIDSLSWAWRSKAIHSMNLYEVFDFVYMDPASGKTYGSPAFEQILDAVRNNSEDALPKAGLRNWIALESAKPQ